MHLGDVFDAARAGFTTWTPLLWDPVGAATVAAVAPVPGERVFDACCGNGASALPAARAVDPGGHVDAVDLAGELVGAGRARAAGPVTFHTADVTTWSAAPYDVVTCVFGVFFFPDMDAGGAHLLSLLRPGGRIAITTWEKGSVEPIIGPFAAAAAAEHAAAGRALPDRMLRPGASARVDQAATLTSWLGGLGVDGVTVAEFRIDVPVTTELAWDLCAGSAGRALLDGLDAAAVERVRQRHAAALTAAGTDTFHVAALIGTGVRG